MPLFWSGSVPDQLSVKTPLLYVRRARQDVRHGRVAGRARWCWPRSWCRSCSRCCRRRPGDAVEGIDVAVLARKVKVTVPDAVGVIGLGLVQAEGAVVDRDVQATDETPEAGALPGPAGSLKATETGKLSVVWVVPSELTTWLVGARGVHQPRGGERARAGDAVLVLDVGGVDGERVLALGGGQADEAADRVGRRPRPG